MNDSEEILFKQLTLGNKLAFNTLFEKYYPRLVGYALSYFNNTEFAEEAVQEVFITLWKQRESIRIEKSLAAYLFRATKNHLLNLLKSAKVKDKYHQNYYEMEYLKQSDSSEEPDLEKFMTALYKAVDKLPPKCKDVFILSKQEGLTYDEIAGYLSISKKTVEVQMYKALAKLRKDLKPYKKFFFMFL